MSVIDNNAAKDVVEILGPSVSGFGCNRQARGLFRANRDWISPLGGVTLFAENGRSGLQLDWRPTMKHQTADQLRAVAEVDERYPNTLSRTERLIRWAERLESNPNRRLFTLHQTEYQSRRSHD